MSDEYNPIILALRPPALWPGSRRTRSASAMTKSVSKLLRIDHMEFNLLVGKYPKISSILMKNISTNLASHVVPMNNTPLEHISYAE